jgi:hypothetical protein
MQAFITQPLLKKCKPCLKYEYLNLFYLKVKGQRKSNNYQQISTSFRGGQC